MQGLAAPFTPSSPPALGKVGADRVKAGKFVAALFEYRPGSSIRADS